MISKSKQGWVFEMRLNTLHYIIGNRTLCGNYYEKNPTLQKQSDSCNTCIFCHRRLAIIKKNSAKKLTVIIITAVIIITTSSLLSFLLRF
jgi:hypothetical protein